MFSRLRGAYGRMLTPLARLLLRMGVGPMTVTVAGTAGVVLAALFFFPSGEFVAGAVVCCLFLLSDGLDGTMARLADRATRFGAFLDSTLDRLADGAVFVGLAAWGFQHATPVGWLAAGSLVAGFLVSYARARAEAEGWDASVGLFERTDRLVIALAAALFAGLGVGTVALVAGLGVVFAGSTFTAGQRIAAARRASRSPRGTEPPAP